jgi:NTE family protein
VSSVLARFGGRGEEKPEPEPPEFEDAPSGLGIPEVAQLSIDTMGSLITRYRLAAQPPDVLVTVPGNSAKAMEFHRAAELIELGRKLTAAALDEAFGVEGPAELTAGAK